MKTKIIKIIIYIQTGVLFLTTFFSYSLAQGQSSDVKFWESVTQTKSIDPQYCSQYTVCWSPSLEMQSYLDFMNEMIGVLNQVEEKDEEWIVFPIKWLFWNKVFVFSSSILDTAKLILKEPLSWVRAISISSIIFTSMWKELLLKDIRWWISMIFRKEPFVRERISLEDLDWVIYDLIYDLAIKGRRYNEIEESSLVKINQVLIKYISQEEGSALFQSAAANQGTQYANLVMMLMRLNTTMKWFIATPRISVWRFQNKLFNDNNEFVRKSIGKIDWFSLSFDMAYLEEMDRKYTCARSEGTCDETVKEALKNIYDLSEIKSSADDSWKTMEDSWIRLKEALVGNEETKAEKDSDTNPEAAVLTAEQKKLLRTVYWIDTTKITEWEAIGLRDILTVNWWKKTFSKANLAIKDTFSKVKDEVTDITDPIISELKYANNMKNVAKEINQNAKDLWEEVDDTFFLHSEKNELTEKMQNEYNLLMKDYMDSLQSTAFTENRQVTRYFFEIGTLIHNTIEDTISESVEEAGQLCENACTNKGTENCYAK